MKELNIIKNVCQNSFWGRTWSYRDDGLYNINDDLII